MPESEHLVTIRLWLELLDYASEHEVPDSDYMFLADRFTQWVSRVLEPHTWDHRSDYRKVWRDRRPGRKP
jgi:hypothetical protein